MAGMTVEQILEFDVLEVGAQGAAEARLRALPRSGTGYSTRFEVQAQERFLRSVRTAPKRTRRAQAVHPADVARRGSEGRRGEMVIGDPSGQRVQGDLTGAELMWLERLPSDPAAVTFDDAVRLARMAASVDSKQAPSSAMLVSSLWEPVRSRHDELVAKDEKSRLSEPREISPEARAAIAEIIRNANPDLGDDAVATEAQTQISAFLDQRWDDYDRENRRIRNTLDEVRNRRRELAQTTRTVNR